MGIYIPDATRTITIVSEQCCVCGVAFGIDEGLKRNRRADHRWFYCPNGHSQHYTAASDRDRAQIAETEAKRLRADNNKLADDNMTLAKKNRSLRARAKNGVCAFCNRHFANVERHVKRQHKNA